MERQERQGSFEGEASQDIVEESPSDLDDALVRPPSLRWFPRLPILATCEAIYLLLVVLAFFNIAVLEEGTSGLGPEAEAERMANWIVILRVLDFPFGVPIWMAGGTTAICCSWPFNALLLAYVVEFFRCSSKE